MFNKHDKQHCKEFFADPVTWMLMLTAVILIGAIGAVAFLLPRVSPWLSF